MTPLHLVSEHSEIADRMEARAAGGAENAQPPPPPHHAKAPSRLARGAIARWENDGGAGSYKRGEH